MSVLGIDGGRRSDANGNPLPSLGPPRLRPFAVSGLEAGSSRTVNLRAYLDSPLEKPRLHHLGGRGPGRVRPHGVAVRV